MSNIGLMATPELKVIVAQYYNGNWGYYTTLEEIMTWWHVQNEDDGRTIIAVDEAIRTLHNGYSRIMAGGRIEYDGNNFALLSKEDNNGQALEKS